MNCTFTLRKGAVPWKCNPLRRNESERDRADRSKLLSLSLWLWCDKLRSHGTAPLQSKSHLKIANCPFLNKYTSLEQVAFLKYTCICKSGNKCVR